MLTSAIICGGAAAASKVSQPLTITDVTFNNATHVQLAPGSDNWATTWADDGHLYTVWGDGGGFGGTNTDGRVSLGFARVEGDHDNYNTTGATVNVWGGKNPESPAQFGGKSYSIISLGGVLYSFISMFTASPSTSSPPVDSTINQLYKSTNKGATWASVNVSFDPLALGRAFSFGTFLNFGQDYAGARDGYVYTYWDGETSAEWGSSDVAYLSRVPIASIESQAAWEFFTGLDGNGNPTWSSNIANRQPVWDLVAQGIHWTFGVAYVAPLRKYLLMTNLNPPDNPTTFPTPSEQTNLAFYQANEPWGPWSHVKTFTDWRPPGASTSNRNLFFWQIPSKWVGARGVTTLDFTFTFTGWAVAGAGFDSWNTIRGTFTFTEGDGGGEGAYVWSSLAMGGGGYATGIIGHPLDADLIYVRTDVGGAFRKTAGADSWVSISDHFHGDDQDFYGGDGIAVDPNDVNTVYMACGRGSGTASRHGIFKSTDKGATWTQVASGSDGFRFDGNKVGSRSLRYSAHCIKVDPNNSQVVYCGSRSNPVSTGGLFRSIDGGATWSAISSVPEGAATEGVRNVAIDPRTTTSGRSATVYCTVNDGTSGGGVYRSTDGGNSFSLLSGSPADPRALKIANDGVLYCTSRVGVHKFTGSWSNITPPSGVIEYGGIDVDVTNSNRVICGVRQASFELDSWYSANGGGSWTNITSSDANRTWTVPWMPHDHFMAATSDFLLKPGSNEAWFTDWYGIWRTPNVTTSPPQWTQINSGYELMVVNDIVAPPPHDTTPAALLISAVADNSGFRHTSLTSYPSSRFSPHNETSGIEYQATDPDNMFRVAGRDPGQGASYSSTNNAASWTSRAAPHSNGSGKCAVSATNPNLIIAVMQDAQPVRSTNGGSSWSTISALPSGAVTSFWSGRRPIAADRINGNKFYYVHSNGDVYRSSDGGATWSGPVSVGGNNVRASPVAEGVVLVGSGAGLWRSTNSGQSFTQITAVEQALLFAFGKEPPGETFATIFVMGRASGVKGIFRSVDNAATWERINTDAQQLGDAPFTMDGDKNVFGRVFIGCGGRGIFVGAPGRWPPPSTS